MLDLIKSMYNFLLLPLAVLKKPSIRVTHTHLTLSFRMGVKKSQFQSEEVIFENELSHVCPKQKLNHANEQKSGFFESKKNYVMHAI